MSNPTRFEAFVVKVVVPSDFFAALGDYSTGSSSSGASGSALSQESALRALLNGPAGTSPGVSLKGPAGVDVPDFVPGGETNLPYVIEVANPADGQPVRELRIVEALNSNLDIRSFQLGAVRLGDYVVPVPQGRGGFSGEFDLTKTLGYVLQVTAGMDVMTGIAAWDLRAVDADTGVVTDLPGVGLLKAGETAELSYTVRAAPEAVTGAKLDAQARVYLDQAAPVQTNVVSATLDATPPTTTLTVQPGAGNNYLLSWSATDDALGSGVREYTVYVSADGHDYTPAALHSTATTFTYVAAAETQPQFLVLAADNAGNVEAPPDGISISLYPPALNLGSIPLTLASNLEPLPEASPPNAPPVNPLFIGALAGVPGALPSAFLPSFTQVISPFAAASFARGIGGSEADVGVIGVAVGPDGSIYATGGPGRNQLFKLSIGGTSHALPVATLDTAIYELAFDRDGQLWATTGGGALVQLDPKTGAVLGSYGSDMTLGLAADPNSSKLYVATGQGIETFDTQTLTFSSFSKTRVEGLALAPDGTLWGVEWPNNHRLVTFDRRGRATVQLDLGTEALALVFGAPKTQLDGLLFVSSAAGDLYAIDTTSLKSTVIASGGKRGAFLAASAEGRIYLGGTDGVDVLFPAKPPEVIATDPVNHAGVTGEISRATITFDTSMLSSAVSDPRSVTDPANYQITDMASGQSVTVAAAIYNPDRRNVELVFESLAPSTYELRVLPAIQDTLGNALAAAYSSDFSVVQDATTQLGSAVAFANTRTLPKHD